MLRVISLNIGGLNKGIGRLNMPPGRLLTLTGIGQFLRDQRADIVLLQEVNDLNALSGFPGNQADMLQQLTHHQYHVWEPSGEIWRGPVFFGTGGKAIFSTLPITESQLSGDILRATVTHEGQPLHIYCVHYPNTDTDRIKGMQMSDVATRMMDAHPRDARIIFGGDFNSGPGDYFVDKVVSGGGLNDTFDPRRGHQWCETDGSGRLHDQIDYILVRGFDTLNYRCVVDTAPLWTDHTAVVVDLQATTVVAEPVECDGLRASVRATRAQMAQLDRRLKALLLERPRPVEEILQVNAARAQKRQEIDRALVTLQERGCLNVTI